MGLHQSTLGMLPLPQGPSSHLSQFLTTSSWSKLSDILAFTESHSCSQAQLSSSPEILELFICLSHPTRLLFWLWKQRWMSSRTLLTPTFLWLPPVFSSYRFSPAEMSYFFHSWRGPSSVLPGRCRLSARSPQHIGKNREFPPLWSSSFFKLFHSILVRADVKG